MKYYNEMKVEILNTPENEEFLKDMAVRFVKPLNVTEEAIEDVRNMVSGVIEDFKIENGKDEYRIGITIKIEKRNFIIEAKKVKIDL